LLVDLCAHIVRELDGGGVARIARPGPVVFGDELLDRVTVERSMFRHVSLLVRNEIGEGIDESGMVLDARDEQEMLATCLLENLLSSNTDLL